MMNAASRLAMRTFGGGMASKPVTNTTVRYFSKRVGESYGKKAAQNIAASNGTKAAVRSAERELKPEIETKLNLGYHLEDLGVTKDNHVFVNPDNIEERIFNEIFHKEPSAPSFKSNARTATQAKRPESHTEQPHVFFVPNASQHQSQKHCWLA